MEDFKLDIMLARPEARSLRLDLPKFTLIAPRRAWQFGGRCVTLA